jgi:hypothetical protein
MNEVRGEWRKLHSEEFHILYSFSNISRQIKSRRMRWVEHVSYMGEKRKMYRVLVAKPEGQGIDGKMGSEWILGGLAGGV